MKETSKSTCFDLSNYTHPKCQIVCKFITLTQGILTQLNILYATNSSNNFINRLFAVDDFQRVSKQYGSVHFCVGVLLVLG
jgi:hypothetical protein